MDSNPYEAPEGILFTIVGDGGSWRTVLTMSESVPESSEWVAKLMQVADHLKAKPDGSAAGARR